MAKIHVLDQDIANKIAAGEVVERPSSVIKELVENALDAGAKTVTVEIKDGGITYMRVSDDGCGMTMEDAKACFLRHATSKIQNIADLYSIETLGFRGEALAAISAVSKIELITSTGDGSGTRVELEGGKIIKTSEVGAPKGTTIIVRDLFFNTPARMRFLRTDRTEASHIASLMDRLAISDPSVSFRLIQEGRQTLTTYGTGSLHDTIYAVYGKDIVHGVLKADSEVKQIRVYGYVSEPSVTRANRSYQICYINGRLIRSHTVYAAIDQAYRNLLFHGRFSVCILKITMPAGLIDVNVHPNKMDVKFSNEKLLFEAIYYAIKNALNQQTFLKKEVDPEPKPVLENKPVPVPEVKKADPFNAVTVFDKPQPALVVENEPKQPPVKEVTPPQAPVKNEKVEQVDDFFVSLPSRPLEKQAAIAPKTSNRIMDDDELPTREMVQKRRDLFKLGGEFSFYENNGFHKEEKHVNQQLENLKAMDRRAEEKKSLEPLAKRDGYRYIGEVFSTYMLVEYEDQLYFIDKHAAHERMIFERIQREFDSLEHNGQQFLVPERVRLTPEEVVFAMDNRSEFYHIGFDIDAFGDKQIVLRSRPLCLTAESATEAFSEILTSWMNGKKNNLTERENAAMKTLACKAAIRGGDENDDEELKKLLVDLIKNDNIHQCPHGRPILITQTKKSIEKSFKRI